MWLTTLVACVAPLAAQGSLKLSGELVDAEGHRVSGAHIVVMCQAPFPVGGDYELIAEATSDAEGDFALSIGPTWLARHESYRGLWVAAHAPGHGVFIADWDPELVPAQEELSLRLPALETFQVRVTDHAGAPVAGARVAPTELARGDVYSMRIHESLWEQVSGITDADGRATLPAPAHEIRSVSVWGDEAPPQGFRMSDGASPMTADLRLASGAFVPIEASVTVLQGLRLRVSSHGFYKDDKGADLQRNLQFPVSLWDAPRGVWMPMDHTRLTLDSTDAKSLALQVSRGGPILGVSAEDAVGPVRIRPAEAQYTWVGRCVTPEGEPAPGVRLHFRGTANGCATTDAEGRFRVAAGAPDGALQYVEGTRSFCAPLFYHGQQSHARNGSTTCDFGDIEVKTLWSPTGQVTDSEGRPVPAAFVVGRQQLVSERGGINTKVTTAITDADGQFQLDGAFTGHPVDVYVRSGSQSATAGLREGMDPHGFQLVPALRSQGQVITERSGDGVPGARLTLDESKENRRRKRVRSGGADVIYSRPDGTFQFQSLVRPDGMYILACEGDTIERVELPPMTGAELAALDTIRVRSRRSASVYVTDSDGAPIEGVRLRFRSSSEESTTDEAGGALLAGGSQDADVLVAVTPEGDRHAMVLDGESDGVRWTLGSNGLRAADDVASPSRAADERRVAAELAAAELELHLENDDLSMALRAIRRLSWSDPQDVLRRLDEGLFGTTYRRDWSVSYVAEALTKTSPHESLSVTQRLAPDMSRVMRVLAAARELPLSEELECLALERASLRSISTPEYQLVAIAKLSERFIELGRTDVAMPLLEEGAAIAKGLPTADWSGFARASFGETLCLVDENAGRRMIESIEGDGDKNRHFGNAAHKLASVNPAAAEGFVQQCANARGSFGIDKFISRVAFHMAPVDLERALRLAQKHDRRGLSHGMIALALHRAGRPHSETLPLLNEAFTLAEAMHRIPRRTWLEHPMRVTGALVAVAAEIDAEHQANWLARGLAVRPADVPSSQINYTLCERAALGFYVAPFAPDIATLLVNPCLALPEANQRERISSEYRVAWAALAVIDPAEARRRAIATGPGAMAVVASILARSPSERVYYVQTEHLNLWAPGKEDL